MPVLQFPTPIPMTNGYKPSLKFAVFADNLATVITPGYLNQSVISSATPLSNSDVIMALYNFNQTTQIGIFATFVVNILTKNGMISLTLAPVILPKVNGVEASNAVIANGQSGTITTSSLTTAGGASYSITWTDNQITPTSTITLTLSGGTNTVKNITLQATPGSGTATIVIYNNTASTPLNGTIIMNYNVL